MIQEERGSETKDELQDSLGEPVAQTATGNSTREGLLGEGVWGGGIIEHLMYLISLKILLIDI